MEPALNPVDPRLSRLGSGIFSERCELNRRYLLSLRHDRLMQNYLAEAGLVNRVIETPDDADDLHLGWEAPSCQLRGHFLGHWLSGAVRTWAATGDEELLLRANRVVADLARCQERNGGEWAGSIPEKYLDWIAGRLPRQRIWAPHYTIHKTLMGLIDMATLPGSRQALEVLEAWARWFHRWTGQFSREQMDDILDVETGGMLEAWADLYGLTGRPEHLELMQRYDRPRLFEPLLRGEDPLTNRHANTTIPEVHGAARAYEVTGDERWRRIVEAYWRCAVTERGAYCTGSQTLGEVWTPPGELAARLGERNQEHCVAYNMIRLADYLLRWTGDAAYADYIELNLWNGVLAQQSARSGMVAYFLPLEAGSQKKWGHPTRDFWCCHGTLVQAHARYAEWAYMADDKGIVVTQYVPGSAQWVQAEPGCRVRLEVSATPARGSSHENDNPAGETRRPRAMWFEVRVDCDSPSQFVLRLRMPGWLAAAPAVKVNGEPVPVDAAPRSFLSIDRLWSNDAVSVLLPRGLTAVPLPDEPGTVAFMDGPVVLAGLVDEERTLRGDAADPATILAPHNEREWGYWLHGYRTVGQDRGFRFVPLHTVEDEKYTVYFPVRPATGTEL